jgi:hypothetical protein
MNKSLSLASVLLVSVLSLSACNNNQTASQSPSNAVATPSATTESPVAQASPADADAIAIDETYREESGIFEIGLPEGYTHEETGSGIAFVSQDESFGGSVDFGSAEGQTLNNDQLETALKQEYEDRLAEVTWQGSEIQQDGSIRVDWVGKDEQGNTLDAVSFIEQRGDNVLILNLFGINKPYQDYNAEAEAIVGSYNVQP